MYTMSPLLDAIAKKKVISLMALKGHQIPDGQLQAL
jgi:hypothetical protein